MSDATLVGQVTDGVRRVGDVLVDVPLEPDDVSYERSARAVLRLIVATLAVGLVAALGELLPNAHDGLEQDLRHGAGRWVVTLGQLGDATAAAGALITVALAVGAAFIARRPRQAFTSLTAAIVAAATGMVAARIGGTSRGVVLAEEWAVAAAAGAVAVSAASFSVFAAPVARWSTAFVSLFTVLGVLGSTVALASRVMALLAGAAVGALAALVFGTASRRITRAELVDGLACARLPVTSVERHGGDARGSQPWLATLATGRDVFVKVSAVDELRSDQLFRLWRRIRMRGSEDERSSSSVRRAVEHEAFVADRAAAAGVRTPPVLSVGTLPNERGMFLVSAVVDGTTLDETADIGDAPLRSAWSAVQSLRRARIAHRDLRAANVMLVGEDAWLIDFGFAEIAASDALLDRDLAELLVSTAALVGVRRAVDAAVAVLGADELAAAIPQIQPLAVSTASRSALDRSGFEELREAVRSAAGISAPELPQMQRVSRKAVLSTVALGLAIYFVLPQVTKGVDWKAVSEAHLGWAAVAVVASVVTYVGAGLSLAGSVTHSVRLLPTIAAQVASSFTNRITPAKVGGMALNVRYLTKQGVGTAEATTGVAVSTAAGSVVHISLTIVAALWAGKAGLPGISAPSLGTVLMVVGALAAIAVVVGVVPKLREWFLRRAVPSLRRSVRSFVEVMRTPRNVLMLLGGSAIVTVANLVAFDVSLEAFGADVPISTAALVYLAGSALASAAPTPGGLGAAEAALVAGLGVVSVQQRLAVPAVLLFRLATFWLPILPGWMAFTILQRKDAL